jgi:hypothetical protein
MKKGNHKQPRRMTPWSISCGIHCLRAPSPTRKSGNSLESSRETSIRFCTRLRWKEGDRCFTSSM